MEIIVERPNDFEKNVKPLLNIGGLIKYPKSKGGVLVSQYKFQEQESNPINQSKKQILISTILRNLGAKFGGQATAIAGYNLQYAPISMEDYANLYLTKEQGWPTKNGDLSALPKGENTFAGVRYAIRDFCTSPLESAVSLNTKSLNPILKRKRSKALNLGLKLDTLFFLHGLLEAREWKPSRREPEPPIVYEYKVNYEDGSSGHTNHLWSGRRQLVSKRAYKFIKCRSCVE